MEVEETFCWLLLHSVPGMGSATFHKLLRAYGSPKNAIEKATESELAKIKDIPARTIKGILEARNEKRQRAMMKIAESLRRRGVELLILRDSRYPRLLKRLALPPPLLFCMGEFRECDERSVAIIGSTQPTAEGERLAKQWARKLAAAGCTIVSGYAHGIDSAAHLGALEARGRTIFVLPTGINKFAPREGFPSVSELRHRGAIISELPVDKGWSSAGALARNRITVGLSKAVLVIEARAQSGTLHTFRIARREGVPAFVLARENAGWVAPGNQIAIAEGGIPLANIEDVEKILHRVFE